MPWKRQKGGFCRSLKASTVVTELFWARFDSPCPCVPPPLAHRPQAPVPPSVWGWTCSVGPARPGCTGSCRRGWTPTRPRPTAPTTASSASASPATGCACSAGCTAGRATSSLWWPAAAAAARVRVRSAVLWRYGQVGRAHPGVTARSSPGGRGVVRCVTG